MILLPIRFSQYDARWCTHLLGNNTNPTYTIYNYGCALCCLAMILKYYGVDTDPDQLNNKLKDLGAFGQNDGLYGWGSLAKINPAIIDTNTPTPGVLTDEQMGEIKSSIDKGFPVLIQIDYNPKTVAVDMHFVVIVGYNPNDENDFTIADPLGGTLHSLKDYLGWYKPSARNTIQSYCVVRGPVPVTADGSAVTVSATIFPQLVHGSSQWDKVVDKYMNGKDPKQTQFEDFANVIGGIQSTATAANNALVKQQAGLATAQQQVTNLTEQLTHSEAERQADLDTYKSQVDALTPNSDSMKKLMDDYNTRLTNYQTTIAGLMKDKHDLAVANAKLQAKQTPSVGDLIKNLLPTFVAIFQRNKKP